MAAVLLFGLVFLPVCYLYGWAALRLAGRLFPARPIEGQPALVFVAGFISLTTVGSVFSVFIPLNWQSVGLILMGAAAIFFLGQRSGSIRINWREIRLNKVILPMLVLFILAAAAVVENATHRPTNPDTGIYHAQAIRWMEMYPAVPGLGNLHSRLAYNSSWLVLNAVFSFAFLGFQSFRLVPAMLFWIAVFDFSRGVYGWLRGQGSPANLLRLMLLPLAFYLFGSQTSSPGTDLPVILILWVLAAAWLEAGGEGTTGRVSSVDLVLFAGAIFLVTVKLSAIPLVLMAVWVILRWVHKPALVLKFALLAGLLLVPWMARNYILSGYLIYPFPALDWFNPDWKIPFALALREQEIILAWARIPKLDASEVLAMPFKEWFPIWLDDLTRNQRLVLIAAAFSPGMAFLDERLNRFDIKKGKGIIHPTLQRAGLYLILFSGMIYWLATAPDLRFGYGFVILVSAVPAAGILSGLDRRLLKPWSGLRLLFVAGLILYQIFFLVRSFDQKDAANRLLLPVGYPQHASEPCAIENATVLCANEVSYTQCWYQPFPCIPRPVENVAKRGEDLGEGFRAAP